MDVSDFFIALATIVLLVTPILVLVVIINAVRKKPSVTLGVIASVCAALFWPLGIAGTLTAPSTWCTHEYAVVEDVKATCENKGKIVSVCTLCEKKLVEYSNKVEHIWEVASVTDATCTAKGKVVRACALCGNESVKVLDKMEHFWEIVSVVDATCTDAGYQEERCIHCASTKRTNMGTSLGHSMKETSRVAPTYENDGLIISKCEHCQYEETAVIPKLEREIVKFDGLELVFGDYSFTKVDNKYSKFYDKSIVKIPVRVTNISNDPHSLRSYYCSLFGTSGVESEDVGYLFSDDVSKSGDLLPGKSCVVYLHIVYDGDGIYTIVLDDFWYSKKTVQIKVQK